MHKDYWNPQLKWSQILKQGKLSNLCLSILAIVLCACFDFPTLSEIVGAFDAMDPKTLNEQTQKGEVIRCQRYPA